MTFAEYNTDTNFDKKESSLDELVKLGLSEGKTSDEIKKSLSPKWQNSKKIGEFDSYVTKYSTPKEEAPKVEEKKQSVEPTPEKVETPLTEEETGIKKSDKNYLDEVNAILNEGQKEELNKWAKTSVDGYNKTIENMEKQGDAFKRIDDHMLEQLPTFLFKRYANGEFGDISDTSTPEGRESKKAAQLRLAHFLINGLQSKLKNASNAAAIAAGRAPMFSDTMSDYEKYQQSNFAKGMENRWRKYEADTQSAIDLVKQRGVENEDALNVINKISMNNRLQNAFNMADANKKAYMIEVLSKVGDKISNWNDTKFINALVGAEITGEDVGSAAALIGARAGEKILDNFNLFDADGNLDLTALKDLINIPGAKEKLKELGIDVDKINFESAGIGGAGAQPDEEKPKPTVNIPTPKGKTYEGDTSREGSFWGGKLDDKTMAKYTALQSKKPSGIETDLMSDEEIKNFLADNPDMKGGDVLKKSGINDKITKQAKELKAAIDKAEKDYKQNKDLDAYKTRVNEINDYFTDLEKITKDFGYANFLLNYENIHKAAKKVNKMK